MLSEQLIQKWYTQEQQWYSQALDRAVDTDNSAWFSTAEHHFVKIAVLSTILSANDAQYDEWLAKLVAMRQTAYES